MRLWHYKLIPVLPRQQLLSQWRECCCIARNIAVNGTPNHILVNKILDYPCYEFLIYTLAVRNEMYRRGYKYASQCFDKWYSQFDTENFKETCKSPEGECFVGWHNERYFIQCYFNLQEKYDCGGITEDEWVRVEHTYREEIINKLCSGQGGINNGSKQN